MSEPIPRHLREAMKLCGCASIGSTSPCVIANRIATALHLRDQQLAEARKMERDRCIKLMCGWCRQGDEPREVKTASWEDEPWTHFKLNLPIAPCEAAPIRRALPEED